MEYQWDTLWFAAQRNPMFTVRASGGMADAGALKAPLVKTGCGFESHLAHGTQLYD